MSEYSHVNELAVQNRVIAMEAISLKPNIKAIQSRLVGITNIFGDWVKNKVAVQPNMGLVIYSNTLKDIQKIQYVDISQEYITAPRGVRVGIPEYVASLIPMLEFAETLERDLLKPFSIWVSLRKAAPASLKDSTNVSELKKFKQVNLDKFKSTLNDMIDQSSRTTELPVGKLYPSLSSLEETWRAVNAMIVRYLNTKPASIVKMTESIADNISELVEQLEKNDDAEKVAPTTVAVLSAICFNMATAVEFYGVLGTLIKELSVVCNNNNVELKTAIKMAAKKRANMVTESLVPTCVPGFTFGDKWVTETDLLRLARHESSQRMPIEDVSWIFEYVDPEIVDDQSYDLDEHYCIAAEFNGSIYPLMGLEYLKAVQSAGLPVVFVRLVNPAAV